VAEAPTPKKIPRANCGVREPALETFDPEKFNPGRFFDCMAAHPEERDAKKKAGRHSAQHDARI